MCGDKAGNWKKPKNDSVEREVVEEHNTSWQMTNALSKQ